MSTTPYLSTPCPECSVKFPFRTEDPCGECQDSASIEAGTKKPPLKPPSYCGLCGHGYRILPSDMTCGFCQDRLVPPTPYQTTSTTPRNLNGSASSISTGSYPTAPHSAASSTSTYQAFNLGAQATHCQDATPRVSTHAATSHLEPIGMSQVLELSHQSQTVASDVRRQTISPGYKTPRSSLTIGKAHRPQPYSQNR